MRSRDGVVHVGLPEDPQPDTFIDLDPQDVHVRGRVVHNFVSTCECGSVGEREFERKVIRVDVFGEVLWQLPIACHAQQLLWSRELLSDPLSLESVLFGFVLNLGVAGFLK